MEATLEIVLPVFGLIGCGYMLARTPLLSPEGIKGLTNFVFYVAIPALLFRTMSRGIPHGAVDFDIIYAFFGGGLGVWLTGMLLGRFAFGLKPDEQALMGMGSTFGNTVMMGIPLIYAAFGESGIVPMTLIVAFHSTLLITFATLLVEFSRGAGGRLGATLLSALTALLKNPVVVGLVAGLLWHWGGLSLPAPAERFIGLLAGAAPACALAALGATLTGFRLAGDLGHAGSMAALKLVLHPVLVWLLATYVFPLDPTWRAVAVIVAALPIGANVFILAQRYDIYTARAASGVLISTAISVVTVAAMVAWFAP